ncbi:hypothetical protein AKJ41_04645, partial [candidate division MSBL1 archaeon SCGC-AAA259O05]
REGDPQTNRSSARDCFPEGGAPDYAIYYFHPPSPKRPLKETNDLSTGVKRWFFTLKLHL